MAAQVAKTLASMAPVFWGNIGIIVVSSCLEGSSGQDDSVLFLVGGYNKSPLNRVEAVDLSNQGLQCRDPAKFPYQVTGIVGTTTGGDVAICGGFYAAYFSPECYRYQSDTDQWAHMADMAEGRSYYGEVQLNSQDFWITGGYNSNNIQLGTTEIYKGATGTFEAGPDLPGGLLLDEHCMVRVDEDRFAILGGQNPTAMMDIFYVYTLSTGEWGQMPGLPAPRALMGCGMVEDAEGKRVVTVAGGIDDLSSYFFDFDAGTWTQGPDLPHEIRFPASVERDGNLLLVGGLCPGCPDSIYLNSIYQLSTNRDKWILRIEHTVTSAEGLAAVLVADPQVECQ